MDEIIQKIKNLWTGKKNVVGHVLSRNTQDDTSLILVKSGEHYWEAKRFKNQEINIIMPSEPLKSFFINGHS